MEPPATDLPLRAADLSPAMAHGPMTDPASRQRAGAPPIPLHHHVGLRVISFGPGRCEEELIVPPWLREDDGRPSLAAATLLADSAIGWAIASAMAPDRSMVTAHLHVEFLRPMHAHEETIRCAGAATFIDADVGFGRGQLWDATGAALGWATMRSASAAVRPGQRAGAPLDAVVGEGEPVTGTTPDEALKLVDGETTAEGNVSVIVRCQPHLANSSGGVHGGVIALMGERALRRAAAQVISPRMLRPLELDVVYVRRLPSNGAAVETSAAVVIRTRRFLVVRGQVYDEEGREAALVRAAFGLPV